MAPTYGTGSGPGVGEQGGSKASLPQRPSENTIYVAEDPSSQSEHTPLLLKNNNQADHDETIDPTVEYVKILQEHLPWYKRPSTLWLLPIFGLSSISSGMLISSLGQFLVGLLCREYMNRHSSSNTTISAAGMLFDAALTVSSSTGRGGISTGMNDPTGLGGVMMSSMMMAPNACEQPAVQAFSAKFMALFEVIGGIASTLTIGYYSSLSDTHGRRIVMMIGFAQSLWLLSTAVALDRWWDHIGLPLMLFSSLVSGLMGGSSVGSTMSLAYAADCTDPAKRSLVYSWLHAGLFLGMGIGSIAGGIIARATGTIMSIVYIDMATSFFSLLIVVFFLPESLPAKQEPHIRELYEKAAKKKDAPLGKDNEISTEYVPWHAHAMRSLSLFKPNGRNTSLILLAGISFLQMLALRGTMSVIILYTNQIFHWTPYEDGILFFLGSIVRLVTLLLFLPVLVHFYQKAIKKKQAKAELEAMRQGKQSTTSTATNNNTNPLTTYNTNDTLNDPPTFENGGNVNPAQFNPFDPSVAASVQQLGEAALDEFTSDEEDEESFLDKRRRQSSVDSATTLSSNRTRATSPRSPILPGSPDSTATKKTRKNSKKISTTSTPEGGARRDSTSGRTKEQTFSDMKFDTWMVRLGLIINSTTYIGYGLATEAWMFYLSSALHAVSIIAAPSMKSLLTALVEPSQFGAALGAIQVVDSIAGIFSPVVISSVYAMTVETRPDFVWYTLAAWTAICVVLAFMIRQKQFRTLDHV